MHDTGIYCITDVQSGRRYVGSAVSFKKRWTEHRNGLKRGKHHSQFMQRTYNVRPDAFAFQVLLYCTPENLLMYEQRFLDAWNPEFNTNPTAGSMAGFKHSPESLAKMSAAKKGIPTGRGIIHSEETRAQISASRKGKGCGERPPEWRANISASLKGREVSQEQREKISATLMGHKQSPEQIEKRMQRLRGRKMPEGFAEAARQRMLGYNPSQETREKIGRSRSKHSDEAIRMVRHLLSEGVKHREIERRTGVGRGTVADVSCGRKYKWVSP